MGTPEPVVDLDSDEWLALLDGEMGDVLSALKGTGEGEPCCPSSKPPREPGSASR